MQNTAKKGFRSVLSMILTFLAGAGLYSAISDDKSTVVQTDVRPKLEDMKQKFVLPAKAQPKSENTPRPRLGNSCPTCGMG